MGIRKASPPSEITVVDTPTEVYLITLGRKAALRKVLITNKAAADALVMLGTYIAAAWVQKTPRMKVVAGQTLALSEEEVPAAEFIVNVYAQSDQQPVEVAVEVDEA